MDFLPETVKSLKEVSLSYSSESLWFIPLVAIQQILE